MNFFHKSDPKYFKIFLVLVLSVAFILGRMSTLLGRPDKYQLELLRGHTWLWEKTFKTTKYTLHETECSKSKEHRFYGITRGGRKAREGLTVAVDPKVIPLGSTLIDETGKHYIAEDTGNGVKGYHVDIFIGPGTPKNRKEASEWGVKPKWFFVIEAPAK